MFLLDSNKIEFPDPLTYDAPFEIIAMGGDISLERVWLAYQLGIFPWYNPGEDIYWWCPNNRFVLFPLDLRVSKSMRKILKRETFTFTENQCFREVISQCQKTNRRGQDGTWLSDELLEVFEELHHLGRAKSIEVWQDGKLVGGLYGIQVGRVFCGESMFSTVSNASKAGFIQFVLANIDAYDMIDCQYYTEHLESLGAQSILKSEFLHILYNKNEF